MLLHTSARHPPGPPRPPQYKEAKIFDEHRVDQRAVNASQVTARSPLALEVFPTDLLSSASPPIKTAENLRLTQRQLPLDLSRPLPPHPSFTTHNFPYPHYLTEPKKGTMSFFKKLTKEFEELKTSFSDDKPAAQQQQQQQQQPPQEQTGKSHSCHPALPAFPARGTFQHLPSRPISCPPLVFLATIDIHYLLVTYKTPRLMSARSHRSVVVVSIRLLTRASLTRLPQLR